MLLKVENLSLYYGPKRVLKDVSFSLEEGEILCIVGESGSGKSSILYSIARLLPKGARVEGSIRFKGMNLLNLSERELRRIRGKEISFVFQEPSLYLDPLFKIGSQIEEAYRAHMGKNGARQKAYEVLRKVGIQDVDRVYNSYPHQLSGGLKQRVCIAIASVCEPSLILADEPTTALDVTLQSSILSLFRRTKEEGRSVLLVTHDFGVVAEIADRVLVLKEGQVVEEGDVYSIFENPKHEYTKRLLLSL
ncbi:peptide/nickel transport system ATP-binding protein [Thermocrinis minervae]|uniref:Peptide/nickel transport system ATP-binding protein n=2 Tax=Thermocrinis minervae TaxID=381751 RepID=A0A1M6SRN8_9AQUI|nr:ABC transporter ATP-binding protein [Thermocrinis minervae]SHK47404.1 peptide/nickel transport system ATP-binding protein [Thermocrinis minervae]